MIVKFEPSSKTKKVSDHIITQIRNSILSGQFEPGDKLSSEKELIEQFGTSKATMREALRVLEVMGLIEIRKGIAGGAFIAEVEIKTIIYNIMNFLHFKQLSIRDITMVRYLIEPTVAFVAASQAEDRDIKNLKKTIGQDNPRNIKLPTGINFHRYLSRITKNSILIMTVDFIDNLLATIKANLDLDEEFYLRVRNAHRIILECIIQKDPVAAMIAMKNDVVETGRYIAKSENSDPFEPAMMEKGDLWFLNSKNKGRVVAEGDPILKSRGVMSKRVGTGQLYVAISDNDG